MLKWSYKHIDMPLSGDSEERLDKLGDDGWELAAAFPISGHALRMLFKRPVIVADPRNLAVR